MISLKDFDESKIVDYADDELKALVNEIKMKKSMISEECAEEMAVYLKDKKFDIYSSGGARKISKISKKYAKLLSGADEIEHVINVELDKREKYKEEMRYSGKSLVKRENNISTEEFLKKEQDKTWAYRSKIE